MTVSRPLLSSASISACWLITDHLANDALCPKRRAQCSSKKRVTEESIFLALFLSPLKQIKLYNHQQLYSVALFGPGGAELGAAFHTNRFSIVRLHNSNHEPKCWIRSVNIELKSSSSSDTELEQLWNTCPSKGEALLLLLLLSTFPECLLQTTRLVPKSLQYFFAQMIFVFHHHHHHTHAKIDSNFRIEGKFQVLSGCFFLCREPQNLRICSLTLAVTWIARS